MGSQELLLMAQRAMDILLAGSILLGWTLGMPSPGGNEECCSEKTVGDIRYTLIGSDNSGVALGLNCLSNCIYARDDDSPAKYCFRPGNLEVKCEDDMELTPPTPSPGTTEGEGPGGIETTVGETDGPPPPLPGGSTNGEGPSPPPGGIETTAGETDGPPPPLPGGSTDGEGPSPPPIGIETTAGETDGPPPPLPGGSTEGEGATPPPGGIETTVAPPGESTAAPGSSTCKCGIKGKKKIINGDISEPGEWPWIVVHSHYLPDGSNMGNCGGTLVASNWAITAAHCFFNADDPPVQELFANTMSVVIGEHLINDGNDQYDTQTPKRKNLKISKLIIHENYDTVELTNDIALLKLEENLDLSIYMPACLPPKGKNWVGKIGWVYGWGRTVEGDHPISDVLRETNQNIISNTECLSGSAPAYQGITDDMMCAIREGTDSCQGDSGGPFTVDVDGKHFLAGVVSWGIGCAAPGNPGVYSDVSYQRDWIDTNINENGGATFCNP